MASEKQWEVLEKEGWEFASFEYDGTAQLEARQYQNQGYEVKLMKERTDTQGLKLYSIWTKKVGMKQGNIGNLDDWVQEPNGTWTYEGYDFTAYIKPNEYWNGRILVEVYYWGFTPKFKGDYDSCMYQTVPNIDDAFDVAEEMVNDLYNNDIIKGGSISMDDRMERSAFAAGFKAGRKHADKKAMKKKASLGSVVFTNEFIVDVEVEVDLDEYIDEYPEDFYCESGEEVMEQIESGEISEDDVTEKVADFLWSQAYITSYINDTVGVEVPFEIRDIYGNEWLQDWSIG